MLAALLGVVAIAALMLLCFPELRQGPLGRVDPLYARIRLHNIVEIQPLVSLEWLSSGHVGEALQRLIKVIGIALFALPCLAVLLARTTGAAWRFWATVALALLAFLPLTFYQVRWATYAEAFLVWPYAAGIAWLLSRFTRAERPRRRRAAAAADPGRAVLAAAAGRRAARAEDRERRPRLSARPAGRGAQSRAGAADAPRLRRLRRRAPVSDATQRAVDPQSSAAAGLRRDLAHPHRDRRRRRPGGADPLRRRPDPAVPERDRAGAVRRAGGGRADALPASGRWPGARLAAPAAARGRSRRRGAPVRGDPAERAGRPRPPAPSQ